jgi:hypothetical protein
VVVSGVEVFILGRVQRADLPKAVEASAEGKHRFPREHFGESFTNLDEAIPTLIGWVLSPPLRGCDIGADRFRRE